MQVLLLALALLLTLVGSADAALSSVNKIAPLWIAPGETKNIIITGTGFSAPAVASMGAGMTVNTTTVNSATQITANVTAAGGAAFGTRMVRVTLVDTSFAERDLLVVSEAFTLKGATNGTGFTAAEQVVLNTLGAILTNLISMDSELRTGGTHWMATGTTIAERQTFFTAWETTLRKVALVTAYLTHTDRDVTPPVLNSTGVGASPGNRAAWVAAGGTEWTALGVQLSALRTALVALATGTTGTAFDQLTRAYDIRVDAAIAAYNAAVYTGKTYAKPYPDDITSGVSTVRVIPQVSAVHGDYRMDMWAMYRSLFEAANIFTHMNTLIGLDQVDTAAANIMTARLSLLFDTTWRTMMAVAHLPDYAFGPPTGRPGMNPRFHTATGGSDRLTNRNLTSSTVFRIHELNGNGISQWAVTGVPALTARGEMMKAVTRLWGKGNDFAAWAKIFFNSVLIPSFIAQAGDRQGEVIVVLGRYTITRMDPPSFRPGTSMTVTIQGTGFENGIIPSFSLTPGSTGTQGVTVTSVSVVSPTQIKARITASAAATPGLRDLTLSPPAQVTGAVSASAVAVLTVGTELVLKGGFTAAEQAAIQNLYDGFASFATAARMATAALGAAGVSRAQMTTIFTHVAAVQADMFKGTASLVHSEFGPNGPQFAQSDGFDSPNTGLGGPGLGAPRSAWVALARQHTDRIRGTNLGGLGSGLNHLASLSTAITAAITSGTDAGVDAALATARDTHLANAISKFAAADMTLGFALPFPDDVVGDSSPSVVHIGFQSFTTHGGHRAAMFGHTRGANYAFEQDQFYLDMIQNATFSSWTAMKAVMTEIFTQAPIHFDLLLMVAGANVRSPLPPPGAAFALMNDRMASVASMWDLQMNVVDLSGDGFIGGATSLNASFMRSAEAVAALQLEVNMPAQELNISTLQAKSSDSWRNAEGGLSAGMRWNLEVPPAAPTSRALVALPSTAPTIKVVNPATGLPVTSATIQSGQPMAPLVVMSTGTTGATPTQPTFSVASGTLPTGITLPNNTNGTATLSGTPTSGTAVVTLRASNGTAPNADTSFTITVTGGAIPPTITSLDTVTFTVGRAGSFTVTVDAPASPATVITVTGDLPTGVTGVDNGNRTFTFSGTPTDVNTFALLITASNGSAPDAVQNFQLTVQTVAKRVRGGVKGRVRLEPSPTRAYSYMAALDEAMFGPLAIGSPGATGHSEWSMSSAALSRPAMVVGSGSMLPDRVIHAYSFKATTESTGATWCCAGGQGATTIRKAP